MPVSINVVKSSLAGVLIGSYDKFVSKLSTKESIGDAALAFSSNLITDAIFSATTMLPQLFQTLGAYAQDIFAAILATAAKPLLHGKFPDMIPACDSYIMNFLVNLGANFFASYAETPLLPMLPSYLNHRIVIG